MSRKFVNLLYLIESTADEYYEENYMCFLDMERLIATEQMDGEVACLRCRGGAKLSQSLDKPPTVKLYISLELR